MKFLILQGDTTKEGRKMQFSKHVRWQQHTPTHGTHTAHACTQRTRTLVHSRHASAPPHGNVALVGVCGAMVLAHFPNLYLLLA